MFFFELGEAETGVVVDGLGGKGIEAARGFGQLIDQFPKVIAGDAAAIEHGREMVVIDGADESDIGIIGPNGDGAVHAVATRHEITKFSRADKGVAAGESVSAAEIDQENAVIGLLGGEFF